MCFTVKKKLPFPFSQFYKKTLRRNVPMLIEELHRMGFDVWVYSGDFLSEADIRILFRLHHVRVDGMVIGMHRRSGQKHIREAFSRIYRISLHVDDESVMVTNGKLYGFNVYQLDAQDDDWEQKIIDRVREIQAREARIRQAEEALEKKNGDGNES